MGRKVIAFVAVFSMLSNFVFADTFLVDSLGNSTNFEPCQYPDIYPGLCTLKAAIMLADSRHSGDVIDFDSRYILDGDEILDTTGLGSISNGNFTLQNSTLNKVGIKGYGGGGDGFSIAGDKFTINGDADRNGTHDPKIFIYNYNNAGIAIYPTAENTSILNTVIGLDIYGNMYSPGGWPRGVIVNGQDTLIRGNVISGVQSAVEVSESATAHDLTIDNNYIGTDITGTVDNGGIIRR